MLQVICALITALGAIAVAVIQYKSNKDRKVAEAKSAQERQQAEERASKERKEAEERARIRAMESRLSMDMMYSTAKLCVGTALAVKRGKANGELDDGLDMVERSTEQYEKFLRDVASDRIGA